MSSWFMLALTVWWVLLASDVCAPRSLLTTAHEPHALHTAGTAEQQQAVCTPVRCIAWWHSGSSTLFHV
jgi:hypothetical protein